ncbi:sialoadhesin-like [Lissotriton helveticus]
MTKGVPVKITCSADHTCPSSPPTLTWDWKDSNVLSYNEDLSNGKWTVVSEMYYTPIAEDHGKSLQCTASYTENITSKRALRLAIRYPPKNTSVVIHGNATFREGDRVTLTCSAVGNPDVSNYSWYVGQDQKPSLGHGQELTVNSIAWNSGPYACAATNAVGSGKSTPLYLTIEHAPKGTYVISTRSVATLECETESSNPPVTHYAWYKDGIRNLNTSEKTLSAADSGEYTCVAHNGFGTGVSLPATIIAVNTDTCRAVSICAFVSVAGNIGLLLYIICARVIRYKRRKTPPLEPGHSMVDFPARKGSSRKPSECQESEYQNLQQAGGEYDTLKMQA